MTTLEPIPTATVRPTGESLSLAQLSAVDLLAAGKNDTETAGLLKVNRCTVTRWRLYSPDFKAALAMRRAEVWGSAAARLRALIPKAIDALADALEQGSLGERAELALDVLKLAGPLTHAAVGSFDPEDYVLDVVKRERAAVHTPMEELIDTGNGLPEFGRHVEDVRRRLADLSADDGDAVPDTALPEF